MTPKRAFWEALGTVAVPSLVIWGSLQRTQATSDERFVYLFLAALPLPLAIPLYHRYMRGPQASPNLKTPTVHWTLCVLWIGCGIAQCGAALFDRQSRWHLVSSLATAIIFIGLGAEQFRREEKHERFTRERTELDVDNRDCHS